MTWIFEVYDRSTDEFVTDHELPLLDDAAAREVLGLQVDESIVGAFLLSQPMLERLQAHDDAGVFDLKKDHEGFLVERV